MAVLALLAAKGAPGVSTWATALTLAWPTATGRQVLLVDADVSGAGPLSAHQRYGLGDGRGLLRWVAGHRGSGALESELLSLDGDGRRWLLPGPPDAAAGAALGPRWPDLVLALTALCEGRDLDVLVDVGRWGSRHEAAPLLAAADVVVLVLRSTFESVSLTQPIPTLLPPAAGGRRLAALLVGERDPYTASEVGRALGIDVVAVLPEDRKAARRLTESPTAGQSRTSLQRAALAAVPGLHAIAAEVSGV